MSKIASAIAAVLIGLLLLVGSTYPSATLPQTGQPVVAVTPTPFPINGPGCGGNSCGG